MFKYCEFSIQKIKLSKLRLFIKDNKHKHLYFGFKGLRVRVNNISEIS